MAKDLPTSGGIPPHRKPYQSAHRSFGEHPWRPSKLTGEQRNEIRTAYAKARTKTPEIPKQTVIWDLAERYKVSASTIRRVLAG